MTNKSREIKPEDFGKVVKSETRKLVTDLTDDEVREAAKSLAYTLQDKRQTEDQQRIEKDGMKTVIKLFNEKINGLTNAVTSKSALKDVSVDLRLRGETVTEVRRDTGEIITRRDATKEEMQSKFI